MEHISSPVGFKNNIVSSHILILIIRRCVNIKQKKDKQKEDIIILELFPYIGLITHREAQLRSELSEAVTKAAETGQSISDGMYKIVLLIKSSIGFFLNLFIASAIYIICFDTLSWYILNFSGEITEQPQASLSYEQLVSEVKQLTKERDHLLAQARKDSETLERKEVVIRAQYEEQLNDSAMKISQVIIMFCWEPYEEVSKAKRNRLSTPKFTFNLFYTLVLKEMPVAQKKGEREKQKQGAKESARDTPFQTLIDFCFLTSSFSCISIYWRPGTVYLNDRMLDHSNI